MADRHAFCIRGFLLLHPRVGTAPAQSRARVLYLLVAAAEDVAAAVLAGALELAAPVLPPQAVNMLAAITPAITTVRIFSNFLILISPFISFVFYIQLISDIFLAERTVLSLKLHSLLFL